MELDKLVWNIGVWGWRLWRQEYWATDFFGGRAQKIIFENFFNPYNKSTTPFKKPGGFEKNLNPLPRGWHGLLLFLIALKANFLIAGVVVEP